MNLFGFLSQSEEEFYEKFLCSPEAYINNYDELYNAMVSIKGDFSSVLRDSALRSLIRRQTPEQIAEIVNNVAEGQCRYRTINHSSQPFPLTWGIWDLFIETQEEVTQFLSVVLPRCLSVWQGFGNRSLYVNAVENPNFVTMGVMLLTTRDDDTYQNVVEESIKANLEAIRNTDQFHNENIPDYVKKTFTEEVEGRMRKEELIKHANFIQFYISAEGDGLTEEDIIQDMESRGMSVDRMDRVDVSPPDEKDTEEDSERTNIPTVNTDKGPTTLQ